MKTKTAAWIVMFLLIVSLFAVTPLMAQSPSCYVTPQTEKTRVVVRELDQDGNPQKQIASQWISLGERLPITSDTGKIIISYQEVFEHRGYQTSDLDCSNRRVIKVP